VVLHIPWPGGNKCLEPGLVAGKQRAAGFLEAGLVPGDGGHEAVGHGAGLAHPVLDLGGAPRHLHQLAQRHRGSAGLAGQPFPVPRQQRDLARHHPEFGSARATRRLGQGQRVGFAPMIMHCKVRIGCGRALGLRLQTRQYFLGRAAPVQFDDLGGGVVEHQHRQGGRVVCRGVQCGLGRQGYLGQGPLREAAATLEGGAEGVWCAHKKYPDKNEYGELCPGINNPSISSGY